MPQWIRSAVLCSILASGIAVAALAGDDGKKQPEPRWTLPGIVITASRVPRDIQSDPSTVYRVNTFGTVRSEGSRTIPDACKGIPSVMLQKTGYGQGSPYLRGFTGFRTLFMVDGIRLNNSVFRDGPNQYWNTVDPLSTSAYELVMGPASVLYGSDAIGGVVNTMTQEPPEAEGSPVWARSVYFRGATGDLSQVARAQFGFRQSERFGFVAGASVKDFGDLAGGKGVGRQKHTGYADQDFDLRLDSTLRTNHHLTLAHQSVRQDDAWRTHRTVYGLQWEGLSAGDDKVHSYDQGRDLTYLRYGADHLAGFADRIGLTVSRHDQTEDLYRVRKDDKRDRQGFDVETWGTTLQIDSRGGSFGKVVYGAEYYRDQVNSYSRKYRADGTLDKIEIQGPVADDASYDNLGVYLQGMFSLLRGRLDLTPGVRYTYARAGAGKVKDPLSGATISIRQDWSALAGSLRLLHPLTADRRHVLFAGVSQGFRAPNLSDLTRLDMARSGELETAAPGLEPERYVALEIGLKSRISRLLSHLGYYYTVIDQMIIRTPTGRILDGNAEVTKKNSGRGYVQGVEISGKLRLTTRWSSWLAGSWMDGKVDAYPTSTSAPRRDYISRLMPLSGQAGLRWDAVSERYWAELAGDVAAQADRLSNDDTRDTQRIPPGGTPGFAVLSVRTGARLVKGLDLGLGVENVFDRDYRIHGSGVNEPGRNVVLTVGYGF